MKANSKIILIFILGLCLFFKVFLIPKINTMSNLYKQIEQNRRALTHKKTKLVQETTKITSLNTEFAKNILFNHLKSPQAAINTSTNNAVVLIGNKETKAIFPKLEKSINLLNRELNKLSITIKKEKTRILLSFKDTVE